MQFLPTCFHMAASFLQCVHWFCWMLWTVLGFVLLYILIIWLWIDNYYFFQAIALLPKHSVCITNSLNYEDHKTAFWIQHSFEWTSICWCPSAGNLLIFPLSISHWSAEVWKRAFSPPSCRQFPETERGKQNTHLHLVKMSGLFRILFSIAIRGPAC